MSLKKISLLGVAAVLVLSLAACGSDDIAEPTSQKAQVVEATSQSEDIVEAAVVTTAPEIIIDSSEMFTERDLVQVPDLTQAISLSLEDGKDLVIQEEGIYLLSGSYTDTMIIIEADDEAKVQLVLDNLAITNGSKPAVYVKSGDKVYLTSLEGDSSLKVTSQFVPDGETNLDAVVYSKSDLVLNGEGTLTIRSDKANAVSTKDDLKITGGTYNIVSLEDGLEANDSIWIYDGVINISTSKDALHAENEEDEDLGYIYIEGGVLNIAAADDAIRGNSSVTINGGEINIDASAEGIEATQIHINGGKITLYSTDDGINATQKTSHNMEIVVNGGEINVAMASGDTDGFDSNGDFIINGGTITVEGGMAAFDVDGTVAFNDGLVIVDGVVQEEIEVQSFGNMKGRNKK